MKILIIGGMHGNEPLGQAVVKLFQQKPVSNVDTVLANPPAIEQNCRFVRSDLNRSFPGNQNAKDYESRRAAELLALTKKYDLVLDFHNTYCPENDCSFVGEMAARLLYDTTSLLGLNRVIVANYDCINKFAPNCISVEISLSSPLNNPAIWYERIVMLSRLRDFKSADRPERFKFVYRMTLDDRDILNLAAMNLQAFRPIDTSLAKKMGVKSPAYPIFIGDEYTPYNFGGLLNKLTK